MSRRRKGETGDRYRRLSLRSGRPSGSDCPTASSSPQKQPLERSAEPDPEAAPSDAPRSAQGTDFGPQEAPTASHLMAAPDSDAAMSLARSVARGEDIGDAAHKIGITEDELVACVSRSDWADLVKSFVMTTDELALELDCLVPAAVAVKRQALTSSYLPLEERNKVADQVLKSRGLSTLPRESKRRMKVTNVSYLRMSVTEILEHEQNEDDASHE